jgi:hypothetical protein
MSSVVHLIKTSITPGSTVFVLSALIDLKFKFASLDMLLYNDPVMDLTKFNMDLFP